MIERVDHGNGYNLRLVECPACKKPLEPHTGRTVVQDHIAEHDPEDFGLSPIGDRQSAGAEPPRLREGPA